MRRTGHLLLPKLSQSGQSFRLSSLWCISMCCKSKMWEKLQEQRQNLHWTLSEWCLQQTGQQAFWVHFEQLVFCLFVFVLLLLFLLFSLNPQPTFECTVCKTHFQAVHFILLFSSLYLPLPVVYPCCQPPVFMI